MPDSDVADAIETAAIEGVQSATVDGQSVTQQSLKDRIAADQYLSGRDALSGSNSNGGPKSAWGLMRPAKVVPPGMQ